MDNKKRKKNVSYTLDTEILEKIEEEHNNKKSKYGDTRSKIVNGRLGESYENEKY